MYNTKFPISGYKVETEEDKNSISNTWRFRLVHKPTNRVTHWSPYTGICLLDDVAALTDFYTGTGKVEIVPAVKALKFFAHTETHKPRKAYEGS